MFQGSRSHIKTRTMEQTTLQNYRHRLALGHATYYAFGGLWPLLSMPTFEAVMGPKVGEWLVRTIALILLLVSSLLLDHALNKRADDLTLRRIAFGISFILGTVAIITTLGGWLSWIFLLDGAMHLLLAAAWGVLWIHSRSVRTDTFSAQG